MTSQSIALSSQWSKFRWAAATVVALVLHFFVIATEIIPSLVT
jgi:hypothetical protein